MVSVVHRSDTWWLDGCNEFFLESRDIFNFQLVRHIPRQWSLLPWTLSIPIRKHRLRISSFGYQPWLGPPQHSDSSRYDSKFDWSVPALSPCHILRCHPVLDCLTTPDLLQYSPSGILHLAIWTPGGCTRIVVTETLGRGIEGDGER